MSSRPVLVLSAAGAVGSALAAGLTARGLTVLEADDPADVAASVGAVVDAGPVAAASPVADLAELDPAGWLSNAEAPLRRALHVLQTSHSRLSEGGRVIVLLPSLVTSGAPGLVPWVAAAEGYRSLTKAAARAWGREGITVNCVLVPADLNAGTSLDRPGLQPPALGGAEGPARVVDIVGGLLSADMSGLTGQTIAVDGGVWMTP